MPIITARGIGVLIVAIIVFVLATYTRVGWLFMFDAVLWGTLFISLALPWISVGKFDVKRSVTSWESSEDVPGPMQNDPIGFDVSIKNRGVFPAIFVTAEYNCGNPTEGQKSRFFITWLGRGKTTSGSTFSSFENRGVHRLGPVKLQTRVPFGLFRKTRMIADPVEVVVLPKVHSLSGIELVGNEGESSPYPVQARVGEQVLGSRNYAPGDPWQHVHWRNTARLSATQIKEFERSPDRAVVIGLDIKSTKLGYDQALEDAVSVAASVGDYVCRSWGMVRVVTGQSSQQTSDRFQLLMELALAEGSDDSILHSLPANISPLSDVLAIALDTDTQGIQAIASLATSQHRVTAVLMRGYNREDLPSRPAEGLNHMNVNVIECWPGEVPTALNSLKRVMGSSRENVLQSSVG